MCPLLCCDPVSMASVHQRFGLGLLEEQRNILEKKEDSVRSRRKTYTEVCVNP